MGFHIPVDQSFRVCSIQRRCDLPNDFRRARRFKGAALEHVMKRLPVDQSHVDVQNVVDLAPVVDGDDMWFLKDRCGPRLTQEPSTECGVLRVLIGE